MQGTETNNKLNEIFKLTKQNRRQAPQYYETSSLLSYVNHRKLNQK